MVESGLTKLRVLVMEDNSLVQCPTSGEIKVFTGLYHSGQCLLKMNELKW